MRVIGLSIAALILTLVVAWYGDAPTTKVIVVFLALEGTALLASALGPPHEEMALPRIEGFLKRIYWWFTEGSALGWPLHYNPVLYYGGLALLALSIVLSALT